MTTAPEASEPTESRQIVPAADAGHSKGQARRAVEQARRNREAHGQVEGLGGGPLVRLSEITSHKVSLQSVARWSGDVAKAGMRRALAPVTPHKAPSNTPWARLLRRVALRGMINGLYRRDGSLIVAGNSDDLLKTAHQAGEDLSQLDAYGVHLKGSDLTGAKLPGADFRDSRIGHVCFRRAKLDGASFARARLTGWYNGESGYRSKALLTDMSGASLTGADFSHARLTGVDFSNADLGNADFTGAKFGDISEIEDKANFRLACICSTIMPVVIPFALMAGGYRFKRNRKPMNFNGANLQGARFSIDAPFAKLGLSRSQMDQLVLVDKRGNVRDDLRFAPDGSLLLDAAKAARPAPALPKAGY